MLVCAAEPPVRSLVIKVDNAGLPQAGSKMPARVKIDFRQVLHAPDARIRPETLTLWHLGADGKTPETEPVPVRFDDPDPKPDSFFYAYGGGGGRSGDLVFQHRVAARAVSRYRLDFRQWRPEDGPVQPSPAPPIGDYDVVRYEHDGPMSGIFHTKVDVADWDGDGNLDIIAGDGIGRLTLYRRLGKDPYRFDVPQFLEVDGKPVRFSYTSAPVAVDWQGRGKLDLIVADETSGLFYLENIGTRTHPRLARPVPLRDATGQLIKSPIEPCKELHFFTKDYTPVPAVFDYFGHGKNDLIFGGYITGRVYLYENVARSAHEMPVLAARGPILAADGKPIDVTWCAAPSFGDLDGDGLPDMVTGHIAENKTRFHWTNEPSVYFYKNTGTREHPVWTRTDFGFPKHWTEYPPDVTVPRLVDWNGDGKLDIVMGARSEVFYFENVGTRTEPRFEFRKRLTMPHGPLLLCPNYNAIAPCLGDLDGDGLPDLIRGGSGSIPWARMVGGSNLPRFEDRGLLSADGKPIYHEFPPGDDTSFPFLYEWSHNGLLDLIVGDGEGYVWHYKNVGTRTAPRFAKGEKFQLTNGQPLCVGQPEGNVGNNFEAHSGNRAVPAPADYLGDGKTHLICGNANGDIFFYRNHGDGRFEPGTKLFHGNNRAFTWPVDWDGDGKVDVVITWGSGPKATIFLNRGVGGDGAPKFEPREIKNIPWIPYPRPMTMDWNHDGQVDLLFASSYALLHFAEHHFVEHGYVEARLASGGR
jgi:hypothetical protein